MTQRQRIVRIRRDYNRWVANQTLEDYALRFTARSARKWSAGRVANTALGAISFLALEAIGGTITIGYGFGNAAAAIVLVGLLIFATGLPIAYYAARYGVDIDLLTRGAGFGYIGSTITSLIYASFTFIFFAIEAAILAGMLATCFGVPQWLGYIVSALVVIPMVTHGITFISRFQCWTQPLWAVLQILPIPIIVLLEPASVGAWTGFSGGRPQAFSPLLFGACASVVFSLVAQIGEQVDFLRFLPLEAGPGGRARWWLALLAAGPGWIVIGAAKMLGGSFLAVLALHHGVAPDRAAQPTEMYLIAFGYVLPWPAASVVLAALFVAISQVKINVTNAYAGSIAWSNFFSRLTHSHPGRVVWLVFNVAIALLLMEIGIYQAIEHILSLYSYAAAAWVAALVADLVVNKPLGLSPPYIEFKRAHLYDVNPVGIGAMALAFITAAAAGAGAFGALAQAFAPFLAFATAFLAAPLIAWGTRGRFYIARRPRRHWAAQGAMLRCCICEHDFEPADMAFCPAYAGPICSLCCSLDARCGDSCKPRPQLGAALRARLRRLLPAPLRPALDSGLWRYLPTFALLSALLGIILAAIYLQAVVELPDHRFVIAAAFWRAFCVLVPIIGVSRRVLVLARDSRQVAEVETRRQTALLLAEIDAHKRTDAALEKAKAAAESANFAKTRYVVGISHELRSPLNAILGYAQLLERDPDLPERRREAVRVIRRSGEHLTGLIEGLLDVSKIEAGRIEIYRDQVRLREFLSQLADMFQLQAEAQGDTLRLRGPRVAAGGRVCRREAAGADPDQPAVQCHQVHHGGGGDAARALARPDRRVRGGGHRPGHSRRGIATDFRAVPPAGEPPRHDRARHRAGAHHHPAAHADHGRRDHGHQPPRRGQRVPHPPDARRGGAARGGGRAGARNPRLCRAAAQRAGGRRRRRPPRPAARHAGTARLHRAHRKGRTFLPGRRRGAAARHVPDRPVDAGDGRLGAGAAAAADGP